MPYGQTTTAGHYPPQFTSLGQTTADHYPPQFTSHNSLNSLSSHNSHISNNDINGQPNNLSNQFIKLLTLKKKKKNK